MLQEQNTFAVENSRQKYARQSTYSSSDQYNNLLNKLRERNVNNDIYIKKYVRKSNRKLQFLQRMKVQPIQSNPKIQAQTLQIKRQAKQLKIVENQKIDKQDETMIMQQPVTIPLAISVETNNQSRTNQSNSQPYQKSSPKEEQKTVGIINNRYKSNKELASYLKNIFLKDGCPKNDRKMIKRKEQMKKVIIQSKENDESRQLYRTKYHLSVKNYVFGSQNIQCKKSVEVDQNKYKQGRIVTELINRYKIQKISQENLLSQGSISSKAIFPSLNNQNHKPKISLDKYIKSGHERGIKENLLEDKFKQGKLRIQRQSRVKIQRQGKLHSDNQQTGYQILNFKINTIQIKKFN